jgi:hypothetical protein
MADVFRVQATWQGFAGAPGYTNHYYNAPLVGTFAAQGAVNASRAFFQAISLHIPSGVSIQVEATVAQLDESTGVQSDEFVVGTPATVVSGGGAATRAAPVGACVTWKTSTFVRGRRLRGRSFIVPLSTASYENDGTLSGGFLTAARAAATQMCDNGATSTSRFGVWSRPRGGVGGQFGTATSASVADRAAVLTSRRA